MYRQATIRLSLFLSITKGCGSSSSFLGLVLILLLVGTAGVDWWWSPGQLPAPLPRPARRQASTTSDRSYFSCALSPSPPYHHSKAPSPLQRRNTDGRLPTTTKHYYTTPVHISTLMYRRRPYYPPMAPLLADVAAPGSPSFDTAFFSAR